MTIKELIEQCEELNDMIPILEFLARKGILVDFSLIKDTMHVVLYGEGYNNVFSIFKDNDVGHLIIRYELSTPGLRPMYNSIY